MSKNNQQKKIKVTVDSEVALPCWAKEAHKSGVTTGSVGTVDARVSFMMESVTAGAVGPSLKKSRMLRSAIQDTVKVFDAAESWNARYSMSRAKQPGVEMRDALKNTTEFIPTRFANSCSRPPVDLKVRMTAIGCPLANCKISPKKEVVGAIVKEQMESCSAKPFYDMLRHDPTNTIGWMMTMLTQMDSMYFSNLQEANSVLSFRQIRRNVFSDWSTIGANRWTDERINSAPDRTDAEKKAEDKAHKAEFGMTKPCEGNWFADILLDKKVVNRRVKSALPTAKLDLVPALKASLSAMLRFKRGTKFVMKNQPGQNMLHVVVGPCGVIESSFALPILNNEVIAEDVKQFVEARISLAKKHRGDPYPAYRKVMQDKLYSMKLDLTEAEKAAMSTFKPTLDDQALVELGKQWREATQGCKPQEKAATIDEWVMLFCGVYPTQMKALMDDVGEEARLMIGTVPSSAVYPVNIDEMYTPEEMKAGFGGSDLKHATFEASEFFDETLAKKNRWNKVCEHTASFLQGRSRKIRIVPWDSVPKFHTHEGISLHDDNVFVSDARTPKELVADIRACYTMKGKYLSVEGKSSETLVDEVVLICGRLSSKQCSDVLTRAGIVRSPTFSKIDLCRISWPIPDLMRMTEHLGDVLHSNVVVGVNDQRAIFRTMVLLSRTTVPMFDPSIGLTNTISRIHSPWAVRLGRCLDFIIPECGDLKRLPDDNRISENVELLYPRIAMEANLIINKTLGDTQNCEILESLGMKAEANELKKTLCSALSVAFARGTSWCSMPSFSVTWYLDRKEDAAAKRKRLRDEEAYHAMSTDFRIRRLVQIPLESISGLHTQGPSIWAFMQLESGGVLSDPEPVSEKIPKANGNPLLTKDIKDVSMLLFEADRQNAQIGFRVKGNNCKWHVISRRDLPSNAMWADVNTSRGRLGTTKKGSETRDYLLPAPQILINTLYEELISTRSLTFARQPIPYLGRSMVNSEYEDLAEDVDPEGCIF
uniref:Uncharacterized protein n=1 Tax=viral metagenome TaxID=1070528 RepID=A0A2V0RIV0_9ZZZZ